MIHYDLSLASSVAFALKTPEDSWRSVIWVLLSMTMVSPRSLLASQAYNTLWRNRMIFMVDEQPDPPYVVSITEYDSNDQETFLINTLVSDC